LDETKKVSFWAVCRDELGFIVSRKCAAQVIARARLMDFAR